MHSVSSFVGFFLDNQSKTVLPQLYYAKHWWFLCSLCEGIHLSRNNSFSSNAQLTRVTSFFVQSRLRVVYVAAGVNLFLFLYTKVFFIEHFVRCEGAVNMALVLNRLQECVLMHSCRKLTSNLLAFSLNTLHQCKLGLSSSRKQRDSQKA